MVQRLLKHTGSHYTAQSLVMKSKEPLSFLFSHAFNFPPISKVETISIPG